MTAAGRPKRKPGHARERSSRRAAYAHGPRVRPESRRAAERRLWDTMKHGQDLHRQRAGQVVVVALALFAAVTAWRFFDTDALDGIGFLYVVPIAALAARFGYAGGSAGALLALSLTVGWAEAHDHISMTSHGYVVRAMAFAAVAAVVGWQVQQRMRERKAFEAQLCALASEDKLTGLPNRRAWDDRAAAELHRAQRTSNPLAVAMIDVDGLKALNDSHGHAAGDRLLVACALAWAGAIRESDFLARIGGDEFALLLPDCDEAEAAEIVTRMRFATRRGHGFSAGIASARGSDDMASLMDRADRALYEAKADRRRSVNVAA